MDKGGHKVFNILVSLIFGIAITLPLASRALPIGPDMKLTEKRKLAEMPELTLDWDRILGFPSEFDEYFGDHFGFRSALVRLFNWMRHRITGLELADKVLVGKRGWYYIDEFETIKDYRGLVRLSREQLERIRSSLEALRDRLEENGIAYLLVVAPAKWEIYPEYVPDILNRARHSSSLDQVLTHLRIHSDLQVLDLRPFLIAAKEKGPVYLKSDTHWNQTGACVATQAINLRLSARFSSIRAEPPDEFPRREETRPGGDLAVMMGLQDVIAKTFVRLSDKRPRSPLIEGRCPGLAADHVKFAKAEPDPEGVKALIFHDSFGEAMIRFLRHSFNECIFIHHTRLDFDLINKERPHIVIQESGQRGFLKKFLEESPRVP